MNKLDFSQIGKRIKEIRTDRHLTQEYLANATDVNVSHISNTLNVTVDYILGNEYKTPTTAFETELLHTVDKLDSHKKEQLLRIAKVL